MKTISAGTTRYDAFGNIISETGPMFNRGFTYTSRERHARSGFYYYRARFYDPQTGRFITPDPIGHFGGVNLYAYVGNSPVDLVDPLGLFDPDSHSQQAFMNREIWGPVNNVIMSPIFAVSDTIDSVYYVPYLPGERAVLVHSDEFQQASLRLADNALGLALTILGVDPMVAIVRPPGFVDQSNECSQEARGGTM